MFSMFAVFNFGSSDVFFWLKPHLVYFFLLLFLANLFVLFIDPLAVNQLFDFFPS